VFINYRHEDTRWAAWALYFKLEDEFGAENVFFDNGTLRAGMQWFDEIQERVGDCGAFVALIGPRWQSSLIAHLQRGGPVLVDDADPPDVLALPAGMRPLMGCHVERLRYTHARSDIEQLAQRLRELAGGAASGETDRVETGDGHDELETM